MRRNTSPRVICQPGRLAVRKIGAAGYEWVALCSECAPEKRTHLVPGIGAVSVNDLIGNRTQPIALAAVHAHLAWHQHQVKRLMPLPEHLQVQHGDITPVVTSVLEHQLAVEARHASLRFRTRRR